MDCVLVTEGRKEGSGYKVRVRAVLKVGGTTVPQDVMLARSYALGGFNQLARHYNEAVLRKRKKVRLKHIGERLEAKDGVLHVEMIGEGEYGTLKLHEELSIEKWED